MIKPEPLKGKVIDFHSGTIKLYNNKAEMCYKEDIRSAVEWLRNKVNHYSDEDNYITNAVVMALLIEAFEDVMK